MDAGLSVALITISCIKRRDPFERSSFANQSSREVEAFSTVFALTTK